MSAVKYGAPKPTPDGVSGVEEPEVKAATHSAWMNMGAIADPPKRRGTNTEPRFAPNLLNIHLNRDKKVKM